MNEILKWFFIFQRMTRLETKMATVNEAVQAVKDEAAAEKVQVAERISALDARIVDLESQIANGSPVTPDQLAEIRGAIQGIFTPPTP